MARPRVWAWNQLVDWLKWIELIRPVVDRARKGMEAPCTRPSR